MRLGCWSLEDDMNGNLKGLVHYLMLPFIDLLKNASVIYSIFYGDMILTSSKTEKLFYTVCGTSHLQFDFTVYYCTPS